MGLIICPDCGQQISDRARTCIHCGCPLNEGKINDFKIDTSVNTNSSLNITAANNGKSIDLESLIEYLKKAKDLESSLYLQKETIEISKRNLKLNLPARPINQSGVYRSNLQEPKMYEKPVRPKLLDTHPQGRAYATVLFPFYIILILVLVFGPVYILIHEPEDIAGFIASAVILWGIAAAFIYLRIIRNYKKAIKKFECDTVKYKKDLDKYKADYAKYINDKESEKTKIAEFNADNQKKAEKEEADYREKCEIAKHNYSIAQGSVNNLDSTYNETKNILEKLYSKDIIFPKYRNFVAVCTFYEYFTSGRVSSLEGPNGAYNLYESELRQNLIINSLDTISIQLDHIKNNQQTIYNAMLESNKIANSMCRKLTAISESAQMITSYSGITAYCSAITASNAQFLTYVETANLFLN